ncbi:peroxiredoxin-2E, chloroplastic [Silene latifolia]|uniref:peroxiredoxin-2E, chloroplastic n=1 Tax=Silene latifolia TaxID=37657 RepID=UPI003D780765
MAISSSIATTTISRLFALSTAKPTFTKSALHFRRSSFTPSLSLRFSTTTTTTATTTPTPSITASISPGTPLPDATFSYLDSENNVQTLTTSDLTSSKKSILFAVPGAFTPTCSQKHVPSFIQHASELKSKGVSVIACISVNDAFVMKAWKESLGAAEDDSVMFLCDVNGEFTKAIGAELDLTDKPVGLGVRSRRYAMLVDDGVAKVVNLEEGGAFTFSSAEDMLKLL